MCAAFSRIQEQAVRTVAKNLDMLPLDRARACFREYEAQRIHRRFYHALEDVTIDKTNIHKTGEITIVFHFGVENSTPPYDLPMEDIRIPGLDDIEAIVKSRLGLTYADIATPCYRDVRNNTHHYGIILKEKHRDKMPQVEAILEEIKTGYLERKKQIETEIASDRSPT